MTIILADSLYVTNQPEIVQCAKKFVKDFPTIVNNIPKAPNIYGSTMADFAKVDSTLAAANSAIGQSSNLAQLCLTYTYNFDDPKYMKYCNILAVLAQVAIDNAKRSYDIDLNAEITRIKKDMEIEKNGYPYFWFYIKRKGKFAKVANEGRAQMKGLNPTLVCPMNYVCDYRFKGTPKNTPTIPLLKFFVHYPLDMAYCKSRRVEKLIEKYSLELFIGIQDESNVDMLETKFLSLCEEIRRSHLPKESEGLVSWLIKRAFRFNEPKDMKTNSNLWRNRATLMKALYESCPEALYNVLSKPII